MPSPRYSKYYRILATDFSRTLQYRADAFLWMLAEAAIPLVAMFIWLAVSAGSASGPAAQDVLTYYIAVIFIKLMTDAWNGAFMARDILEGEIAQDLVRPLPVVMKYIANNLTEKIVKIFLPVIIIVLVLATSPDLFSPTIWQPQHWALFAVSLSLAMVLAFVLDMAMGLIAFWLEDAFQIRQYKEMVNAIASGILIPLAFLPPAVAAFFNWLPFRYVISAPAEILTGQYVALNASGLLAAQFAWVAVLIIIIRWQWTAGLKRYAVPGK